jgi:hypothetical protein
MTAIHSSTPPLPTSSKPDAPMHIESAIAHLGLSRQPSAYSTNHSSTLSLPSLQHKHNLRDLGSAHAQRVKEIELSEQALWKTISPAQAKREVDPAQLVGKLVRRGDEGAILRHSGRRICLEDDKDKDDEWRVVLEGEPSLPAIT